MRQSQLFTKTKKESPKDEEAKNAQLLIRGGYVDKLMAGVYTFLPLGLRVFKNVETIIREEMEALGAQEILMPTLHPKVNWETSGRWDGLDNLFRFTSYYSKIDYALGATHEEIVSPLMKDFVFSYKDLPTAVFQIQNKFRDEKRAKSGILRGREFFMKDLYSFHTSEEDLDAYYLKAKEAYIKIFERAGLGDITYFTYASGGTFSKYSHEFQTVTEAGEDVIYICDACHIAINDEIIAEQSTCPECGNDKLRKEKAVEVGNIFKLKTKYSAPFQLTYKDAENATHDVVMGCYGIGLNRLMGTIVEVYHDESGIIWPEAVAPYRVHLVNLHAQDEEMKRFGDSIYEALQGAGVAVLYDDRGDAGIGEKLKDSDLIGIPLRAIISAKNGTQIEVKKRKEKDAHLVTKEQLLSLVK
jgi:prolyl-tRNA synthetase